MGDIRYLVSKCSKLDTKIINEKFQEVFNKLDSVAKNQPCGLFFEILRLVNINVSRPMKTKTSFEISHLLCTKADLVTIQYFKKKNFGNNSTIQQFK